MRQRRHGQSCGGMEDVRQFPVAQANFNDRWAILQLAAEGFGISDPAVASLSGLFAVRPVWLYMRRRRRRWRGNGRFK